LQTSTSKDLGAQGIGVIEALIVSQIHFCNKIHIAVEEATIHFVIHQASVSQTCKGHLVFSDNNS
jgi:hypothetical protein